MYLHIEIAKPYSIREIFDGAVHQRVKTLRKEALEAFDGHKPTAWRYLCRPRHGWADTRSLFQQSLQSSESHQLAMDAIMQMVHGVYV